MSLSEMIYIGIAFVVGTAFGMMVEAMLGARGAKRQDAEESAKRATRARMHITRDRQNIVNCNDWVDDN